MADETQGNPAPHAGQGTDPSSGSAGGADAPRYVTEEQLNRAISARLGDHQKKTEKALGEFSAGILSKLDETLSSKLEAFRPAPATSATQSASEGKKNGDAPPPLVEAPEIKTLYKRIEELTKKSADAEARAAAERAKGLDSDLRNKVRELLIKSGFDAPRANIAVGHLVDSVKCVAYNEDGIPVFRADGGELDLTSGIREWRQTDEGKALMPKRGVAGSGDGPRSQGGSPNGAGKQDPRALLRDGVNRLLGREPPRE